MCFDHMPISDSKLVRCFVEAYGARLFRAPSVSLPPNVRKIQNTMQWEMRILREQLNTNLDSRRSSCWSSGTGHPTGYRSVWFSAIGRYGVTIGWTLAIAVACDGWWRRRFRANNSRWPPSYFAPSPTPTSGPWPWWRSCSSAAVDALGPLSS